MTLPSVDSAPRDDPANSAPDAWHARRASNPARPENSWGEHRSLGDQIATRRERHRSTSRRAHYGGLNRSGTQTLPHPPSSALAWKKIQGEVKRHARFPPATSGRTDKSLVRPC